MKSEKALVPFKKSKSAWIVAKILAVLAFFATILLIISEVLAFCTFGIPLLVVHLAQVQGVMAGSDWVIGGTLWFLPSLFLVLVLAGLHVSAIKIIVKRVWSFMYNVMRTKFCDNNK